MVNMRKVRTGRIVSDKMDKTVVVLVQTPRRHPVYKKYINQGARFKAHDPENACRVGDMVKIAETRPLSKDKCWRVVEILRRKEVVDMGHVEQEEEVKLGAEGQ